uniref:Uncharacterized protein LOC104234759 isoform X5 n=1 Tax=Nicotiana sylvestris TaxID=4096 RepID=A0A1U7X770_NICSY|nr:PREDICTED: uncharacterized protein LOC104234759 isoform X5 [Nicotiana sylvestris]
MSGDKKDVPISCSGQKNKSPCLTDRSAEMKFNRRKKYKEISADRKEALLLNRRMKELDSRKCLLESRTLDNLVKLISLSNSTLQRESALMIRDFSLTSNQGSTSGTFNDRCGVGLENVANRGVRLRRRAPLHIIGLQTEYVSLKVVPICKFCAAKRFQYEPPRFYCNKGSIKLTSHEMPIELRELVLVTTKEFDHFRTYVRTYNNMFVFTSLGVKYDKDLAKRNYGIYTFRIQEKMYHFVDDLYPANEKGRNLQLYFYDNENEVANRIAC